jgi:hypothetical protein
VKGFSALPVAFVHQWDGKAHPFTGAAVIDIDGDNQDEIFVGGGQSQSDSLLSYQAGRLVDVIAGTGLSQLAATHGATSIDIDGDGDVDLLVAREDGVYLHLNNAGKFSTSKIPVDLPPNSVPFDVAVSDIDRDGDGDLYISVFVNAERFKSATYNDPEHAKPNRLLLNNGDLSFTDITEQSGAASRQNSFLSVFVDLNSDNFEDLVVSQNTGEIEIFRNNGNRTFTLIPLDEGFGFWMGIAVGDVDRDGDQDLFFSNIGGSIPGFFTSGDLKDDQRASTEWLLLRNDGDFKLTNVTEDYGLTNHGFAWGAVFEDLNFDGQLDLLVAQNYIKWPIHKLFKLKGRSFLNLSVKRDPNAATRMFQIDKLGLQNKYYGQSPLITDVNNDGRQDVIWINMDGPVRAFINNERGNFVAARFPDNVASLGIQVTVTTTTGKSYTRVVTNSVGLLTDQSSTLTFGLGETPGPVEINIQFPNGSARTLSDVRINQVISID